MVSLSTPAPQRRNERGFTLVELLMGMAVLSIIAVAVAGISISFLMKVSDGSSERQKEATTAQWASMTFARDVQGAGRVVGECAPGNGTRLITLQPSGAGPTIEYRVTHSGTKFGLERAACGPGASAHRVTSGLNVAPTISCDGAPCAVNSSPRVVSLHVSRSSKFEFSLDGVRRTTDGNIDPNTVPREIPPFVSLGGDAPLSVTGAGRLTVIGDAFINNPGQTAAKITNSGSLTVGGDLLIQNGSTPGPVLVASGNPILHVNGSGPAPSQMNVCGWCDIKIQGTGPGTYSASFPDPFAFLAGPDTSTLPVQTSCTPQTGYFLCKPGIYTGVFPPGGLGDSKFKLEPGNYVLRGGVYLSNGRSAESLGGVLLYIEAGAVTVSGDAQLTLQAPSSGTYSGLLFFQPATNTSPFNISNGGRVSALGGTIYAPAASSVNLSSGAGTLNIRQVIGRNISITNSGMVIVGGS